MIFIESEIFCSSVNGVYDTYLIFILTIIVKSFQMQKELWTAYARGMLSVIISNYTCAVL